MHMSMQRQARRLICRLSLFVAKKCLAVCLSKGSRALQRARRSGTRQVPQRRRGAPRDARAHLLRTTSGSGERAHYLTTLNIIWCCQLWSGVLTNCLNRRFIFKLYFPCHIKTITIFYQRSFLYSS